MSPISAQLKNDYPELNIYIDAVNRMVVADNYKMSLLNSTSSLETMNIFSRSGRSFYQAIVQLLYSNYNIIPHDGSYASSLIILKEDLKKYKIQKLAKEWGIGFLEENGNVLALDIDDGIERDLLLVNENDNTEPYEENERFTYSDLLNKNSQFAKLEELAESPIKLNNTGKNNDNTILEELESVEDEIVDPSNKWYRKFLHHIIKKT